MYNMLIVEDHDDLREVIIHNVKKWGFRPFGTANANDALIALDDFDIELILLDLMLPGLSGTQFLEIIRKSEKTRNIPVLISSIINQEQEIVAALNLGADDYISKPFSFNYLQAKITSLLRRSGKEKKTGMLEYDGIKISPDGHELIVDGNTVSLTFKEYKLLSLLLKNVGKVYTRENLLNAVWGYDAEVNTRTVDAHVSSLRKKLKNKGSLIKSISKIGYGVGI